jgi:hypothetical protein
MDWPAAETYLAALTPGARRTLLGILTSPSEVHADVSGITGRHDPGPHSVGRLDAVGWHEFEIRVTPKTGAGRDARELLREGLLEVSFDDGAVRLVP